MSRKERVDVVRKPHTSPERIREEIAYLETRLGEIGYDGDCAYENAMVRFFEQEVAVRRTWLEAG